MKRIGITRKPFNRKDRKALANLVMPQLTGSMSIAQKRETARKTASIVLRNVKNPLGTVAFVLMTRDPDVYRRFHFNHGAMYGMVSVPVDKAFLETVDDAVKHVVEPVAYPSGKWSTQHQE